MSGMFAPPALSRAAASDTVSNRCKGFKPTIPNVRLEFSEALSAGSGAKLPYRDRSCGGPGLSPLVSQDVCRVAAFIRTSERSGVHFEAWLPQDWNGRFLATGNGGIGGCKCSQLGMQALTAITALTTAGYLTQLGMDLLL
jgi:feruloyl esterase